MKKLLVLMLVLGLTSLVQADLLPIEISVNGVYDGTGNVTEVTLETCNYLEIDVAGPEGLDWTAYLVIDGSYPALGEWGDVDGVGGINGGHRYLDTAYPKTGPGLGLDSSVEIYDEQGWGFGYLVSDAQFSGTNPGGSAYIFRFHCVGTGDISISLYNGGGDYVTPDDRVIIHQIPEPATIALLGLGGLLLRRRK